MTSPGPLPPDSTAATSGRDTYPSHPVPQPLTSPRPPSTLAGVVTVLLTLAGWSVTPLFIRYFADHIDAWTSNGWRYTAAAIFWAPALLVLHMRSGLPATLWKAALVPAVVNSMGQVCFTWAHYRIDPALLSFGLRSQIVFVSIGAFLLFPSERRLVRTPAYIVGFALVIGGASATALLQQGGLSGATLSGFTLALAAGAFFAAYGLSVRHYMHAIHPVTAFAAISVYTAIAQLALMLALGDNLGAGALSLTGAQFAILMLSALIGIALGHVFYYLSIANLGVAVSAGVIQLQPFGVAIGSYLLFSEVLSTGQWIAGAAAVLGAVLMLEMQRRISRADRIAARRASDDAILEAAAAEGSHAADIHDEPSPAPAR